MNLDRFVHYKTGYPVIDDEHFAMLKKMDITVALCAASPPVDATAIKESLIVLEQALLEHLVNEEALMRNANYKYIGSHIEAHNEIRKQMASLIHTQDFNSRHIDYIIKDLEHIFVAHIDAYDMQIKL